MFRWYKHKPGRKREMAEQAWNNLMIEKGMAARDELAELYKWYKVTAQSVHQRKEKWRQSGTMAQAPRPGRSSLLDSPTGKHKAALRKANQETRGVGGARALAVRVPGGGTYRGVTKPTISFKTAATWTKKLRYKMIGVKPRPTLYPQH